MPRQFVGYSSWLRGVRGFEFTERVAELLCDPIASVAGDDLIDGHSSEREREIYFS